MKTETYKGFKIISETLMNDVSVFTTDTNAIIATFYSEGTISAEKRCKAWIDRVSDSDIEPQSLTVKQKLYRDLVFHAMSTLHLIDRGTMECIKEITNEVMNTK